MKDSNLRSILLNDCLVDSCLKPLGQFSKFMWNLRESNSVSWIFSPVHTPRLPKFQILIFCGESRIRTCGTSRYDGFQDRCNRPLYHLSKKFYILHPLIDLNYRFIINSSSCSNQLNYTSKSHLVQDLNL